MIIISLISAETNWTKHSNPQLQSIYENSKVNKITIMLIPFLWQNQAFSANLSGELHCIVGSLMTKDRFLPRFQIASNGIPDTYVAQVVIFYTLHVPPRALFCNVVIAEMYHSEIYWQIEVKRTGQVCVSVPTLISNSADVPSALDPASKREARKHTTNRIQFVSL